MEKVITLGKFIGLLILFCHPLLCILFENSKNKTNDLAHPVMGTIVLVISWIFIQHDLWLLTHQFKHQKYNNYSNETKKIVLPLITLVWCMGGGVSNLKKNAQIWLSDQEGHETNDNPT